MCEWLCTGAVQIYANNLTYQSNHLAAMQVACVMVPHVTLAYKLIYSYTSAFGK
jgi:hypothetical protein